jgi:hypothetical protein
MINRLPLDLFGEVEPAAEQAPESARVAPVVRCGWCGVEVRAGEGLCPACGSNVTPAEAAPEDASVEMVAAGPRESVCQWCGAEIGPEDERCPACGWDARPDNEAEIPGLTVPLSETQVRAIYGGDEEDDADAGMTAIAIISEILRSAGG